MSLFVTNFHSIVSGQCPSAVGGGFAHRNSDLKNPHVTPVCFTAVIHTDFPIPHVRRYLQVEKSEAKPGWTVPSLCTLSSENVTIGQV